MDVRFCIGRNLRREAQIALEDILIRSNARSPKRTRKTRAFRLTLTYMEVGFPDTCFSIRPGYASGEWRPRAGK